MRKPFLLLLPVLLLIPAVAVGIGWYFSGQVLAVEQAGYPLTVGTVGAGTVTLPRTDYLAGPGRYGLSWPGGHAVVGDVVRQDAGSVTRRLQKVDRGRLTAGQHVSWDSYLFDGDPHSAFGLDFTEIRYTSDAGRLPAWYVPGRADTWVVSVHGRGGSRRWALRTLPALHRAGYPVLIPSYRNDRGVPAAAGHEYRLGATEWRDVDGAMRWARRHGARRFVLFGESMGGGMALQAADRSALRSEVRAVVLDSPTIDWRDILEHHARLRRLPSPLIRVAERVLEWRAHLSLDRLDWVRRARDLRRPVLIFHGPDDTYVPWRASERLAARRPDLVRLERFDRADHVQSWNVDPARYERDLLGFLARTAPADPPVRAPAGPPVSLAS